MTYKPTDEQIDSLACVVFDETLDADEIVASEAFRAIMRAAQAEAWDEGAARLIENPRTSPDDNPFRGAAS